MDRTSKSRSSWRFRRPLRTDLIITLTPFPLRTSASRQTKIQFPNPPPIFEKISNLFLFYLLFRLWRTQMSGHSRKTLRGLKLVILASRRAGATASRTLWFVQDDVRSAARRSTATFGFHGITSVKTSVPSSEGFVRQSC